MTRKADVLIVGAGIAGLMAANALRAAGKQVLVVDKGSGVGGRMATRRIGPGRADHGAQFFTVRTAEFQRYVDPWLRAGLVRVWSRGWSDGSLRNTPADGYPRYAVRDGMTAVPKQLAAGLDIRTGVRLTAVQPTADGWQATDEAGSRYDARALLLTPPVPQSLALLQAGSTSLSHADRTALQKVTYAPCLCGLFWVDGTVQLPEPGALQRPLAPISWIADNQRKGISPQARLITVHGGPVFSQEHFADADEAVMARLRQALAPHLAETAVIHEAQLHRWRYALPITRYPERTLLAENLPPLAFAGDAFKEPRVEGAALSGLAAARKLTVIG
ncbi:MAG: FAD-dependent oxidoreductase [Anaerolineales bacterium]|nr:FAD-dependent oxidoreductase [Anaerolineales bacterium]